MADIVIANEDKRYVAGWASVEIVDSQGDVVPVSELTKAFLALMDRGGHIIYGHKNYPVGRIMQWEVKEHPISKALGVYMIVKINSGYEADDMVWSLIKQGKLKGFSIGGKGRSERTYVEKNGIKTEVRILKSIQLNEVSVVDIPANPLATIDQVAMIAKCAKCDALEKSDGAMTSGDAGNNEAYSKPKKKPEDEEDEKDEDKKKAKEVDVEADRINEMLKIKVETIIKDHLLTWARDMKITPADTKQDERKDNEKELAEKRLNEIDATANPNSKATMCSCQMVTKSIDDLISKIATTADSYKKLKLDQSVIKLSLNLSEIKK